MLEEATFMKYSRRLLCVTFVSPAVILSRSQANEESRVGLDPKPGTEIGDGVEWLNKAERNRSTKS